MATETFVASDVARKYLRLHLAEAVGPVLLTRLIDRFGTIDAILSASLNDLMGVEGIGRRRSEAIFRARGDDSVDREVEKAWEANTRIICWEDKDYPKQLRYCDDPPICLYVKGHLQPQDAVSVAIVGSRKCSRYGYEQARRFGGLLGGAGLTVISGLARGIDGYAHEGALIARGRTLAVLGCGVDVIYPPEHEKLADSIIESGALISEAPMGSAPSADAFPRRNRIIAGMSLGTIVIEASKRSGALITARLAAEYNREVFALPGRVDVPTAVGPNDLIRKGAAKLVASLEDILDELGETGKVMANAVGGMEGKTRENNHDATYQTLNSSECKIVDYLGDKECGIDEIALSTELPIATVTACLTTLQLKGLVVALPGARFAIRSQTA